MNISKISEFVFNEDYLGNNALPQTPETITNMQVKWF
jgi:hypothetical protein